ncbi:MAG: hypothetical protein ACRDTD_04590 [Pseudonocardiaceae bacterium]
MSSEQVIMDELHAATREHPEWTALATTLDDPTVSVHLAVMLEPFLRYVLNGQKTVESRFSKNAIAPYGKVAPGDLVLMKAGPVVGSFRVASVEFGMLNGGELARLRHDYARTICADDDQFWQARADKRYATLVGVDDVRKLPQITVPKRDRRGWVVLRAVKTGSANDVLDLW